MKIRSTMSFGLLKQIFNKIVSEVFYVCVQFKTKKTCGKLKLHNYENKTELRYSHFCLFYFKLKLQPALKDPMMISFLI